MTTVRVPDGKLVKFPDNMSNEDIAAVLRKKFPPVSQPPQQRITPQVQSGAVTDMPEIAQEKAQNDMPMVPVTQPGGDIPSSLRKIQEDRERGYELRPPVTKLEAGGLGLAEEASMGLGAEIPAALQSLQEAATSGDFGQIKGRYLMLRDLEQKRIETAKEQQPGAYYTGAVAGTIATPALALKGVKVGAEGVKRIAALGALEGFGKSEGETPAEVAVDSATGALTWVVGGKAAELGMKWAAKGGRVLANRYVDDVMRQNFRDKVAKKFSPMLKKIQIDETDSKKYDEMVAKITKEIHQEIDPDEKKQLLALLRAVREANGVANSTKVYDSLLEMSDGITDIGLKRAMKSQLKKTQTNDLGFLSSPIGWFKNLPFVDQAGIGGALLTGTALPLIPMALRRGAKGVGNVAGVSKEKLGLYAEQTIKPIYDKYGKKGLYKMGVMAQKLGETSKNVPGYMGVYARNFEKYNDNYRYMVNTLGVAGAGVLHAQLLQNKEYREAVTKLLEYSDLNVTLLGNPKQEGK